MTYIGGCSPAEGGGTLINQYLLSIRAGPLGAFCIEGTFYAEIIVFIHFVMNIMQNIVNIFR